MATSQSINWPRKPHQNWFFLNSKWPFFFQPYAWAEIASAFFYFHQKMPLTLSIRSLHYFCIIIIFPIKLECFVMFFQISEINTHKQMSTDVWHYLFCGWLVDRLVLISPRLFAVMKLNVADSEHKLAYWFVTIPIWVDFSCVSRSYLCSFKVHWLNAPLLYHINLNLIKEYRCSL